MPLQLSLLIIPLIWVDSLTYEVSNTVAVVEVVGQFNDASRKIRVKMQTEIPSVFNDYGLLTDGVLTINGDKILNMSVHANGGLNIGDQNNTTLNNNAVATQSVNSTADPPHANTNPIDGYVPEMSVPVVPISELRTQSQSDSILLDINQADLNAVIAAAPSGSNIYISGMHTNINKNDLYLSGDLGGKTIFVEGNITLQIDGANPLSNVTVVSAGDSVVNGSVDIGTSHAGQIDVVFACGGDVELNGSRDFTGLFWANGEFTQNGSSTLTGRVIADSTIFVNGSFVQTSSDEVSDNNIFNKVMSTASWQQISMD